MKMNKYKVLVLSALLAISLNACQDELDVKNPNAPTVGNNIKKDTDLIRLSQGGTYFDGFSDNLGWLGDSYFSLPWAYQEIMADLLGADASNNQVTTIGIPQYFVLDNGTKVNNLSSSSVGIIRTYNSRAATGAGNNVLYYQWLANYALNNAANFTLSLIDKVTYTGDEESKKNTLMAWAYWWKGFAYQQVGTMYYAGVIVDEYGVGSNVYVPHDEVLARSDYYFNLASTTLDAITSDADYKEVLGKLIPAHCQVDHGGVLTKAMWKRNINTMLARNILLNKLAPFVNGNVNASITGASTGNMAASDWAVVSNLTANGIQQGDFVFTGRTNGANDFFSASAGYVAVNTAGDNIGSTLKLGERFVQNFKPGDQRFTNNISSATKYNNSFTYTTRWSIVDGGNGKAGVFTYANSNAGEQEVLIAGSYEENALMRAEASIRQGNIDPGLALIDDVRDYLGAGLAAVSGTGLNQAQAMQELVRERRVALMFRGISFFDSRRWGWIYDVSQGGGSYGNTLVVNTTGAVNTNVMFNYDFMDYWDVPADETVLNPPAAGSVEVLNPNYQ